jgi:group I intron endonuclease
MGFIYCFVFPNGKRYVGATTMKNPKDRWQCGKKYHVGTPVRTAIDEFGWRHVTKLCCWVPDSELDEHERYWIEKYKTMDPEYGYNMLSGGKKGFTGRGGYKHPLYGKHHSDETIRKMSDAKKGDKHPLYGKHHSDETRKKMSEARKLYWAKKKGLV